MFKIIFIDIFNGLFIYFYKKSILYTEFYIVVTFQKTCLT